MRKDYAEVNITNGIGINVRGRFCQKKLKPAALHDERLVGRLDAFANVPSHPKWLIR